MQAIDVSNLPLDLPEEYTLTAGRPGKETGAFEIILSTNRPASAAEASRRHTKTEQLPSKLSYKRLWTLLL